MFRTKTSIHPLLEREIRPIYNWHEWLARWQAAKDLQWMESLLHCGFDVSLEKNHYEEEIYTEVDRLAFYFTIADSWANSDLLSLQGENNGYFGGDEERKPYKLRQQLARKAFSMLCLNLFKMELKVEGARQGVQYFHYNWETLVVRLLSVIQNFFKTEESGHGSDNIRIRNLPTRRGERSHNEQQAVNFLLNLATFLWEWTEPDTSNHDPRKKEMDKRLAKVRAQVDAAKPWMIEILIALDKLDVLSRKSVMELDEACLTKLNEIALRNHFNKWDHPIIEEHQLVASIDEACYLGSKVAWFLKKHELLTTVHQRLVAIHEAELEKLEVDRKIKELSR